MHVIVTVIVIHSNMTLVLNADSFSDSGLANTEAVLITILNLHVCVLYFY